MNKYKILRMEEFDIEDYVIFKLKDLVPNSKFRAFNDLMIEVYESTLDYACGEVLQVVATGRLKKVVDRGMEIDKYYVIIKEGHDEPCSLPIGYCEETKSIIYDETRYFTERNIYMYRIELEEDSIKEML